MTIPALYPILLTVTLFCFALLVPGALLVLELMRQRNSNRLAYVCNLNADSLQAHLMHIRLSIHDSATWYQNPPAISHPLTYNAVSLPTELVPGPIMLPRRHHETLLYADEISRTSGSFAQVTSGSVMAS